MELITLTAAHFTWACQGIFEDGSRNDPEHCYSEQSLGTEYSETKRLHYNLTCTWFFQSPDTGHYHIYVPENEFKNS